MIQDLTPRFEKPPLPAIVLVEPDEGRRDELAELLDRHGFGCRWARDWFEATQLLAGAGPAADLMLAGTRGLPPEIAEGVDAVRRLGGGGYLAVVIHGPGLDSRRRAELLAAGVDDVLAADRPDEELVARIRAALAVKAVRDELARCRTSFRETMARQLRLVQRVKRHNHHLRRVALVDPLTGVSNLRYFHQWLQTQFEIARRYQLVISVLMIDIDHFKQINDTCGHPFGDYVLTRFAEILSQQVRASDVVARMGGDEFAIGLVETGRLEAVRFGRRLLHSVAGSSFEYFGQAKTITMSIGQAGFPEDAEVNSAEQLVLYADQALYLAKSRGRNDLAAWHELDPTARRRLASPSHQAPAPTVSAPPTLCLLDPE